MATKTIINCMDHNTMTANDKGISIIIDPQSQYNGTINSKIIKIQHSNEQQESHNITPTTTTKSLMTLNNNCNKNGKTLIDIKSNNDHYKDDNGVKHQQQHILQIECSVSTSNEISPQQKEMLNSLDNVQLESKSDHLITERRGNYHDFDDDNEANDEVNANKEHLNITNSEEQIDDVTTKTQQRLNSLALEEDKEESGQTASQQQQKQQQQYEKEEHYKADHQSCFKQVENNGINGSSSKTRENGQKHLTMNEPKQKQHESDDDDYQSEQGINEEKYDNERIHNESLHLNEVSNRKENSDNDRKHNGQNCLSSVSGGNDSGVCRVAPVKREVLDFSHAKRSLYEENSNSLLTKADASTTTTTTTSSKTLLTISATPQIDKSLNVKSNFEENSSEKVNHVVKIQIKPNNSNPLTEKQITVVKIENLEKETICGASEKASVKQTTPVIVKEKNVEKMVQKPSSNSAANATTVTVMNGNNNLSNSMSNGNNNANGNGALTGSSTTVTELNVSNPQYLYYMMSSGQFSPCDTLDSGTGSDLESNSQQNQESNKKSSSSLSTSSTISSNSLAPLEMHLKTTKVGMVNTKNNNSLDLQQRQCSFTDSEESEASSLSCDSLHSNEFLRQSSASPIQSTPLKAIHNCSNNSKKIKSLLPDSLLREIKNLKFSSTDYEAENEEEEEDDLKENSKKDTQDYIKSHEFIQSRKNLNNLPLNISSSLKRSSLPSKTFILNTEDGTFIDMKMNSMPRTYEADKYYNFHVNEHDNFRSFGTNGGPTNGGDSLSISDYETKSLQDDVFAGYRDLRCSSNTSTIRSSKGTVRGVKNRVRNGIATFLQLQQPNIKNYKEKDSGKVVLYTTSMGIIRDTYAKCSNIKKILRTLLVKFEERDVFMSVEYQQEIKERMHTDIIKVPQLYVEGQHIGDADTVERLNETGELRQLLKPYKSISTTYTCQTCGGYRLLPCPSCNGSKKSVHRNHFTAEFVALKCMNCDEVGLVKCHNC